MALQLKNKAGLDSYIKEQQNEYEASLIYALEYFVAELQNHAKEQAGYKDQTANLKSSIGGVVLKNGKVVSYATFVKEPGNGKGKDNGMQTGMEFINSLIPQFSNGYIIILVAGMEYATFVENYRDKNVLKKTELYMRAEMPKLLKDLKFDS
jgi:hypothetical protein